MEAFQEKLDNPFYDKRDQNYRAMLSECRYFELFSHKKEKCGLRIPDTIVLQQGRLYKWFFNSQKDRSHQILMKNNEKLSFANIFLHFARLKTPFEDMNPLELIEFLKNERASHALNSFLYFENKEKLAGTPREIARALQSNPITLSCIQSCVELKTHTYNSRETLYCEYRHDPNQVGPLLRYYKKSFFISKRPELKHLKLQENRTSNLFQGENDKQSSSKLWDTYETSQDYPREHRNNVDYLFLAHIEHGKSGPEQIRKLYQNENQLEVRVQHEILRGYINRLTKTNLIKNSDQTVNKKLEEGTRTLIRFIESTYKIKVRKLISKFLLDAEENVIFIGAKELLFDFIPNADYDHIEAAKMLDNGVTLEAFLALKKKQRDGKVSYRDPNLIKGTVSKHDIVVQSSKRPISANLFKKMILRECRGDFCDFFVNNPEKALTGLEDKKMIADMSYSGKIYKKNCLQDIMQKPYEITKMLKMKCRDRLDDMVNLLKANHILPGKLEGQMYGYSYDQYDSMYYQQLVTVFDQHKEIENIGSLYSTIKVCKMCYTIYALANKEFTENEQSEESYINFNKRYSKIGSIGVHPTSRPTSASRKGASTRGATLLLDETRQTTRPVTGRESLVQSRTNTPPPISGRQLTQTEKPSILIQKNLDLKLKLNLKGALRSDNEEGRMYTKISFDPLTERKASQPTDPATAREVLQGPPSQRARVASSRRVTTARKTVSVENSFEKKPRRPSGPKNLQSITNSRLAMGLKSSILSIIDHLPKDIRDMPAETNKINLYDFVQDGSQKPLHNLSEVEKNVRPLNGPRPSLAQIDSKRSSMFQELIKAIRKESDGELSAKSEEKSITSKRGSITSKRGSLNVDAKVIEKIQKKNIAIRPARIDAIYTAFHSLRFVQPNKITTPKLPFDTKGAQHFQNMKSIPLEHYCNSMGIPPPNSSELKDLQFFIYDTTVGIPYYIRESDVYEGEKVCNLVFCNDFFDNFIEFIDTYKMVTSENDYVRVILFNLPGQAYTSYDPQVAYTNDICARIIDNFLFHLDEIGKVSFANDDFQFVGYGYGGNILATMLSNTGDMVPSLKSLLIINGFTRIDSTMTGLLEEMYRVIQTCPEEMADLPYNYFSILCGGATFDHNEIEEKIKSNPISVSGRLSIIRGIQESVDITKLIKKIKTPIFIVHSMKNCFVPVENVDRMMEVTKELSYLKEQRISVVSKFKKVGEQTATTEYLRKQFFYDGPHNIVEQRPADILRIVSNYVSYFRRNL